MAELATIGNPKAREYETIYLLKSDVARESQEKIAGRLEEVISREHGKLTQVENWGRRQLAYAVSKNRRGIFIYLKYLGGGSLVSELERNLRLFDDVLKYQTVVLRKGLDASTVDVDPANVKFEAVEPPAEDEPEVSIERLLGLVDDPMHSHSGGGIDDDEDFDGDLDGVNVREERS